MLRRLGLLLVTALLLTACGDDTSSVGGAGEVTAPASPYPPTTEEALADEFDALFEPLGLTFTYGGLFDRSNGGYAPSATGGHLALYAEPIDEGGYDTADYVDGLATLTALVTPLVFERWSGLESFDICQEPPSAIDDRDNPAPYTQIDIERAEAEAVDWDAATVETVVALGLEGKARVVVTPVIREHPDYQAAETAALATG